MAAGTLSLTLFYFMTTQATLFIAQPVHGLFELDLTAFLRTGQIVA